MTENPCVGGSSPALEHRLDNEPVHLCATRKANVGAESAARSVEARARSGKATGTYHATSDDAQRILAEFLPLAGAGRCAVMQDNTANGVENGDQMVRGGLEPPTHGFSVHCSTN